LQATSCVPLDQHTDDAQTEQRLAIAGYAAGAVQYVPVSASQGANVVRRDPKTEFPWYSGPTLLAALERTVSSAPSINSVRLRWNLVRPRATEPR
jgi:translation elongation factor EF-1alpha